jgi:hypothetical protein
VRRYASWVPRLGVASWAKPPSPQAAVAQLRRAQERWELVWKDYEVVLEGDASPHRAEKVQCLLAELAALHREVLSARGEVERLAAGQRRHAIVGLVAVLIGFMAAVVAGAVFSAGVWRGPAG